MLAAVLTSMMISALVIMLAFPKTPAAKSLHRHLVERPVRFCRNFTWAKLGRMLLLAGAVVLLASMGPEMLLLMAASGLDAAALLEVMLIVWAASVSGGIAGGMRRAARIFSGIARIFGTVLTRRGRSRTPRRNSHRPSRKADDPNEPGWALA